MWRRPDGRALVATTDFFTPIVDDARSWGRIAAANAASDVYAMGATPLFALNIAGWPREKLPLDLLGEVLAGGAEVALEGGWAVVGGHTIDSPEPLYGQAVVGDVAEDALLTNRGGRAGEVLVLTKAIGTGLVSTAIKRGAVAADGPLADVHAAAVASMTTLNREAAAAAHAAGASAATDVTGFGLLGHLHQLARASDVAAQVDAAAVPVLPGAWDLLDGGYVAGGTRRNVEHLSPHVAGADDRTLTMLADAQTSGGLVFACPPQAAAEAVARLVDSGHAAAMIGSLAAGVAGTIRIA